MMISRLDAAVSVARALGHPARLRAVAMLRQGELCVCQITAVLGLAPSTVSAHLRELRRAGLTAERKDGRWVRVVLSAEASVKPWIESALAAAAGDEQIERDRLFVEELQGLSVEDLCRYGYEMARSRARGDGSAADEQRCEGSSR